jgi:hypothetical protein
MLYTLKCAAFSSRMSEIPIDGYAVRHASHQALRLRTMMARLMHNCCSRALEHRSSVPEVGQYGALAPMPTLILAFSPAKEGRQQALWLIP